MRRLIAGSVVLVLFAAGSLVTGASAGADDSAVTKDEIKVGISYVDLAAVRAAGINRDHGDYEKAYQTVIDDLNAKGGVNGRKIVPVYAAIDPIGTDPAQQACLKLTEDEKVFAAIGQFQGDAPLCYLEQHNTPVVGGAITNEYLARAKAPWYTLDQSEADTSLIVDALAKEGAFKKRKVGVVAAAADESTVDKVVVPTLKKNKVSPTVALNNAPTGDIPAGEAETDTILERFKADGVKTILAVGGSINQVAQRLARTDYRPRVVATSQGSLSAYINTAGSDKSVLKDAVTGGPGFTYDEPTITKCRDKVATATGNTMVEFPEVGAPSYRTSAETACRYIALFAELAKAAGKQLTTASFGKAALKAGSVTVPGSDAIVYNAKTHTFAQPIFLARYDPAQQRLVTDTEPATTGTAQTK
jgi:ABC-type branched-subunit amino acid transport system substrate-binding protein